MVSAYAVVLPSPRALAWPVFGAAAHDSSAAPAALASPEPPSYQLTQLHDSVLNKLLAQLDTRSKCALMCTCTHARQLVAKQEHWRELAFDTANEQHGLDPAVLVSLLKRSQGSCQVIQLAR